MRKTLLAFLLALFFCFSYISAQNRDIQSELERFKTAIERTEAVINLLPRVSDRNIVAEISARLNEAKTKYQQAKTALNNGNRQAAQLRITQGYALLRQIETIVRQHPVFKLKFQEELDGKIQQAERIVQLSDSRELLYLLDRAKTFRRRALQTANQGQLFAALEYYRLAIYFADQIINHRAASDKRNDTEYWRNYYVDTQVLLERARILVENSNTTRTAQLRSMLEKANAELKDIERLYERKEYDNAQQKLVSLNRVLYRVIDLAEDFPQRESERLVIDLDAVRFSLQTINDGLRNENSPAAKRIYFRATTLTEEIQQHIEQNQLAIARRKLRLTNQLVLRLYRMVEERPASEPQEIARQLSQAQQNLGELRDNGGASASSAQFIQLIEENLRQAETANTRKDYLTASRYLKISNRLILRFNRLQSQEQKKLLDKQTVQADLQRLAALLARLDGSNSDDPEFNIRYQNAQRLYGLANQAYENNELILCKELTTMAINLITK